MGNNNTLGTIDDESAVVCHVGYEAQEHVLHLSFKILVIRIGTVELELGLQWNTVSESFDEAFFYSISWRIDIVVKKFQYKVVAGVRDGEILAEHFVQSVVLALLRWCVQLEKVAEGL